MKTFIGRIQYLNLLTTFDNALDTLNYLKTNKVDLLFLDIQMETLSGLQFLKVFNQWQFKKK